MRLLCGMICACLCAVAQDVPDDLVLRFLRQVLHESDDAMADWYVDSAASAGGDGSSGSPFDSIADLRSAGVAAGDNVYLTGTFRGGDQWFSFTGPNGLTIQRWPGQPRPMIRGDVLIAQTAWTTGGGTAEYNKNIGVVATTGSISIGADATTDAFTRSSGSWITDGFVNGDLIEVSGFTDPANNGIFLVSGTITATNLPVAQALNTEAAAAGRAASVILVSVVEDWDTRFKAVDGGKGGWQVQRHMGHMPRGVVGSLAAGQHHYDGATGLLTVRARDSANLNSDPTAHQYAWCQRSGGTNQAPFFMTSSGSNRLVTFRGIDFALWPAFFSYCIRCHGMEASLIEDCTFTDFGGFHACGFAGDTHDDNRISGCTAAGHNARASACNAFVVAQTFDAHVANDNAIEGCTFHAYGLLDTAGNLVNFANTSGKDAAWTGGASGDSMCIHHTGASGFMGRFTWVDCTMVADYSESGILGRNFAIIDYQDQDAATVPSDPLVKSQYGVRVERCEYHGHGIGVIGSATAIFVGRSHFDLSDASLNTGVSTNHFRQLNAGQSMYFEACTILWNGSASSNGRLFDFGAATADIVFVLCTVYDLGTNNLNNRTAITRVDTGDSGAGIFARQSLFVMSTGGLGTPMFYTFNSAPLTDAYAGYDFDSCWYESTSAGTEIGGVNDNIDTIAEWTSVIDPDDAASEPVYDVDPQLTNPAGGDLSPVAGGQAATRRFVLPSLIGVIGINGLPYDGHYGAYQFGGGSGPRGRGRARDRASL